MRLLIKAGHSQSRLYLYNSTDKLLAKLSWPTDRQLADKLLIQTKQLLTDCQCQLKDLTGVGVFAGPGSFTGLRLSHALANTLAYALSIPVANASGSTWRDKLLVELKQPKGAGLQVVVPEYGQPAKTTTPKK